MLNAKHNYNTTEEADDDFFPTSASTSNLANLFGTNAPSTDQNASLVYSAPKQPKTTDSGEKIKPKPQQQTKLICVKTVLLDKEESDSIFRQLGKFGIAIIGDDNIKSFDLILYKTRQQIHSTSKLKPDFTFCQLKNYSALFKDDRSQSWRVHFDNAIDSVEFSNQLKSKGVVVIPYIEELPKEMVDKTPEDARKLDDSDGSTTEAFQHILERISKVGQSMLPNTKIELSESDPEEVIKTKKIVRKPKRHTSVDKDGAHSSETFDQNQQFMVPVTSSPQPYPYMNQFVPAAMMQCMSLSDPLSIHFAEMRTHFSEVRMNLSQLSNKLETVLSEPSSLRTNNPTSAESNYLKNKITDLEQKLNLLSISKTQGENDNNRELTTAEDTKVNELQEKQSELLNALRVNQELKDTIENLNQQIESQNCIISNQSSQNEIDQLNNQINSQNSIIEDLELASKLQFKENEELKEKITSLQNIITEQTDTINAITEEKAGLSLNIKELEGKIDNMTLKLHDFEEKFRENSQPDKLQVARMQEDNIKMFTDLVKHSMNHMYQNILEKFVDENYNLGEFKKVLSNNMKNATFQILQEYKSSITEFTNQNERINNDKSPPVPEFEVTV